jgi:hypothetical protein
MVSEGNASRPVSRVLYPSVEGWWPSVWDDGCPPPLATNPRTGRAPKVLLFGLAPGGVCPAGRSPDRWCALTAPFHPCPGSPAPCGCFLRRKADVPALGGVVSVALSVGSPLLGVTQHPARRSSDFPLLRLPAARQTNRKSGHPAYWRPQSTVGSQASQTMMAKPLATVLPGLHNDVSEYRGRRRGMAEVVRELTGDPSCVLASLAERLERDGWRVTTRSGPLLQAGRDGRFLSLTVLGSARGTRVHAEGSPGAIAYLRRAIGPGSAPPEEFSLARGRRKLGAAITAALGLTVLSSLLLLLALCQSPSSSNVGSTTTTDSAAPAGGVRQLPGEGPWPALPATATPPLSQRTPAAARAAAARPRPRATPSPVAVSVTPEPPAPTSIGLSPQATSAGPSPALVAVTSTPTRAARLPAAPTPTLDLSRLADAYGR